MNVLTNLLSDKIQPAPGYLLVKTNSQEEKTSSGIYIAQSKNEESKAKQGLVISVGDKVIKNGAEVNSAVKSGNSIIYKSGWGSEELNLADGKYQIISFEDLLAIIK